MRIRAIVTVIAVVLTGLQAGAEPPPPDVQRLAEVMFRDLGPPVTGARPSVEERSHNRGEIRLRVWAFALEGREVRVSSTRRVVVWEDEARLAEIRSDPDPGPGAMTTLEVGWAAAERLLPRLSLAERGLVRERATPLEPYRIRRASDDRLVHFRFTPVVEGVQASVGNVVTVSMDKKDLKPVRVSVGRIFKYRLGSPISRDAAARIVRQQYEEARSRNAWWDGGRTGPDWSRLPASLTLDFGRQVNADPQDRDSEATLTPVYRYAYMRWGVTLDALTGEVMSSGFAASAPTSPPGRAASVPAWSWAVAGVLVVGCLGWAWARRLARPAKSSVKDPEA